MSVFTDVPTCSKSFYDPVVGESQLAQQILLCLKPLDELLKCHICFEYFNTCVITKCCHSFCSLCIRKYLSYKAQCPQCFKEATAPELQCNRQIDEVLLVFNQLMDLLQPFNKSLDISNLSPCKSTSSNVSFQNDSINMTSTPKCSTSITSSKKPVDDDADIANDTTLLSETSVKDQDVDRVSCPACSMLVFPDKINTHLDWCLTIKDKSVLPPENKRKPLAKVVYHLLTEKEIKKRLKEHGLSTAGNRQRLVKRHKSFVLLYNSECDKINPRPVSELVKEVEREEIEVKTNESTSTKLFQTDKKSNPTTIEEENERYLKKNKSQFDSLVQDICRRRSQNKKESSLMDEGNETLMSIRSSPHNIRTSQHNLRSSQQSMFQVHDIRSLQHSSTTSDPPDESADILNESSPDLFKDLDLNHGSSEAVAPDDDIVILENNRESSNSSEDFVPYKSTRRMLKRKMTPRNR